MPVKVRIPGRGGSDQREVEKAEDIAVDETGALVLTAGQGRDEVTVAVWAPGMWISAEQA